MSAVIKRIDSNFGRYGNIEIFADKDGNYSVFMFISNQGFISSISINLRNLKRKEAIHLSNFNYDDPYLSLKVLNYVINNAFRVE